MASEFNSEDYRESAHKVVIVAGGSGSGKTSLIEGAIASDELDDSGLILPSYYVTRPPRVDRVETNYNFVTPEEFKKAWDARKMFERTEYNGYLYGSQSPEAVFEEARLGPDDPAVAIYDLDIQEGVPALLENSPGALLIAIRTYEDRKLEEPLLIERMRGRGDSEDEINHRLSIYYEREKSLLFEGASDNQPNIIIVNVGELAVAQSAFNLAILNGTLPTTVEFDALA
jgi:guanylate kinase